MIEIEYKYDKKRDNVTATCKEWGLTKTITFHAYGTGRDDIYDANVSEKEFYFPRKTSHELTTLWDVPCVSMTARKPSHGNNNPEVRTWRGQRFLMELLMFEREERVFLKAGGGVPFFEQNPRWGPRYFRINPNNPPAAEFGFMTRVEAGSYRRNKNYDGLVDRDWYTSYALWKTTEFEYLMREKWAGSCVFP